MIKISIVILFFLSHFFVFSQSTKGITGKPDTSYSLYSAYAGTIKTNPEAKIVNESHSPGTVEEKNIAYCTIGSRKFLIDAFFPKQQSSKRIAVIIVHGGGWRTGNRTLHYPLAQRLADLGYVCFTPEYRLSTEALYPAGVYDVKSSIRWVRKNAAKYNIDPNKIVVAGHSAGGELAAMMGATNDIASFEGDGCNKNISSKVNAVIDMDGLLAFIHPESGEGDDSKRTSAATNWFGYSKIENPELWKQGSPLTHTGPHTPPTLFINSNVARMHAGRDDYINVLDKYNIYTEVRFFDAPHSFVLFEPWFTPMVQTMNVFLKKVFDKNINSTVMAKSKAQIIEMPLYKGAVPNSIAVSNKENSTTGVDGVTRVAKVSVPSLTMYKPANANGMSIIICPGGGYSILAIDKEGTKVAEEFNKWGITAFVLKYRLPDDSFNVDKSLAPLQDAQQAIRLIRSNSKEWAINKNQIGIMGFSAGGHLASTAATHFTFKADATNNDTTSVRPDFAILLYPVISFDTTFAHVGSRNKLIGTKPTADKTAFFSNELHVTSNTPPTFIVHASDDAGVPVENSIRFYQACVKNKVPVGMHLYPHGGHGFGLNNKTTTDNWMERLKNWLSSIK